MCKIANIVTGIPSPSSGGSTPTWPGGEFGSRRYPIMANVHSGKIRKMSARIIAGRGFSSTARRSGNLMTKPLACVIMLVVCESK